MVESAYAVKALDESTWEAFAALVERNNGVFGGCWCMGFHPEGVGKETTPALNRQRKLERVGAETALRSGVHRSTDVEHDGVPAGLRNGVAQVRGHPKNENPAAQPRPGQPAIQADVPCRRPSGRPEGVPLRGERLPEIAMTSAGVPSNPSSVRAVTSPVCPPLSTAGPYRFGTIGP